MAHRKKQRVVHIKKVANYTCIDNALFIDSRVSVGARIVLAYVLTKPPHWKVRRGDIARVFRIGLDQVARLLKELEQAGYLVRIKVKRRDGRIDWETMVFEVPLDDPRSELLEFDRPEDDGEASPDDA